MVDFTYLFTKDPATTSFSQLYLEIGASPITIALSNISSEDDLVSISFKAELSSGELATLSGVVSAHTPNPNFDPPLVLAAGLDQNNQPIAQRIAPTTPDGEMHTVQSSMANITGNSLINWTMEYTLNAGSSISERFIVPDDYYASLEFLQASSSVVNYSVELDWYVYPPGGGAAHRRNPAISAETIWVQEVDGDQPAPDTTIKLKNANGFIFADLGINLFYQFLTASGIAFTRQVTAKNQSTKVVTLSAPIPTNLQDGDRVALIDRSIAKLGGAQSNTIMDFEVPPYFRGDGNRYLQLTLNNDSLLDSGSIFTILNGWLTPVVSGTIPGQGGGGAQEDEE